MTDYISKAKFEELMQKKSRNYFDLYYADKIREHYNKAIGCSLAADEAHDFPAEDVQPVKHGRWIWDSSPEFGNPYGSYVCSECDERQAYRENYCPNCGADMREEEGAEDNE